MSVGFDLTICGKRSVPMVMRDTTFDAIISIRDPSANWAARMLESRRKKLREDCDTVLCLDFLDNDRVPLSVVKAIVSFVKKLVPGSKVLLHCELGVARSTAAAIILLREHGWSESEALAEVKRVRPVARPNESMLFGYDEIIKPCKPVPYADVHQKLFDEFCALADSQ